MNILLGVCGSISAYRSLDICRALTKSGHKVKVVLTRGALEFVKPEVFKYLGAEEVFHPEDDFNLSAMKDRSVLHIEISKWAERIVIAPASANTLAKMANGMCEDLLGSIFLASPATPTIIYPAMNTNMLEHPLTKKNFDTLNSLSNVFIHPTKEGLLACGDTGAGKLQDVDLISETAPIVNLNRPKRKILITTGATIAPLDPVRYLTNPSSGITGYELAKKYIEAGDFVTLIAGYNGSEKIGYLKYLPNVELIYASTTKEVEAIVKAKFDEHELYISSAALSDIQFDTSKEKLKKDKLHDSLKISRAPDVLKEALKLRTHQKIVGFAAETSSDMAILEKKWKDKPVDVLVGNVVSSGVDSEKQGFGKNENNYTILKAGKTFFTGKLTKRELADKISKALED